jgi:hypothetical protein
MLVYPQLVSGALAQFPVRKRRRLRTIENALADGSMIKLADPQAAVTEWRLEYTNLSDAELSNLQQFFISTEGSLNVFTFLDPTTNLLAWSDHLDNSVWVIGPYISLTANVTDPSGGTNGWRISNSGAGSQSISQTLSAPGGYLYTLSAYVQSSSSVAVTLLLGAERADRVSGTSWQRITLSTTGDGAAESVEFGLELPGNSSVDLWGFQVEPQRSASAYRPSTTGGVYERAYFRDDALLCTATDVNRHAVTVNIINADSL